jgi:hypothetical protein
MKHQVIFIEGLPGSGKTTYARKLADYYRSQGYQVEQYNEGDLNPIDLAWCAYCTDAEYRELITHYPEMKEEIVKNSQRDNDHYIIAYTRINHPEAHQKFFDEMEKYEVYQYDSRKKFLEVHLSRWRSFNKKILPQKIYIFECIFLQNHINELILNDNASLSSMESYFKKLISTITRTKPIVFYIEQTHIEDTLNRIIEERRSNDHTKYRDWIDNVSLYVKSTQYGDKLGFTGIDGFLKYGQYRQDHAIKVLNNIQVDYHLFKLDDDYDSVFEKMKNIRL